MGVDKKEIILKGKDIFGLLTSKSYVFEYLVKICYIHLTLILGLN